MPVKVLADLRRRLDPLARKTSPLSVPPPRSTRFGSPLVLSRVHWVEPKLVAEITYLTWTADGLLATHGLRRSPRGQAGQPSAPGSRATLSGGGQGSISQRRPESTNCVEKLCSRAESAWKRITDPWQGDQRECRAHRRTWCSALAPNLFQVAEQSGACLVTPELAAQLPRHHRPAAFFDVRRLLP